MDVLDHALEDQQVGNMGNMGTKHGKHGDRRNVSMKIIRHFRSPTRPATVRSVAARAPSLEGTVLRLVMSSLRDLLWNISTCDTYQVRHRDTISGNVPSVPRFPITHWEDFTTAELPKS